MKLDYILEVFSEHANIRSSRPEVFCLKLVLRNFEKFTGKHTCESLFFNKVAGLRPATLLKKRLWHRCFLVNFANFLRTPFSHNTSRQLLLYTEYVIYILIIFLNVNIESLTV